MKSFPRLMLAALVALVFTPALAAPLPFVNTPMDTPQALVNTVVTSLNNNLIDTAIPVSASGTTTATATGRRVNISVTGLTTAAAGTTSAAMVVTNTAVTAASQAWCQVNDYAGGGAPIVTGVLTAANTLTFAITNVAASGALDATVPVACFVLN